MTQEVPILRPLGRVSEPSYTQAPPGSLLAADNCVLREPGVLEPIRELIQFSNSGGPTSYGVWQISPPHNNSDGSYPDHAVYVTNGLTNTHGLRRADGVNVALRYPRPTDYLSYDEIAYFDHGDGLSMYPMWSTRKNLYVSDQRGVYKWTTTNLNILETVWDPSLTNTDASLDTSGTTWLAVGDRVDYRIVFLFRDANGVERRGYPVGRFVIENTGGATARVKLGVRIQEIDYQHDSFLGVEVYRTRSLPAAATIPSDYYFVRKVAKSEFSLSPLAGIYFLSAVYDEVDDANVGDPLYTNGVLNEAKGNIAPPSAMFHASWNGHEFWADVAEKEFFPALNCTVATSNLTRSAGGTITSGSNVATGMATTAGFEVGMLAYATGLALPVGTYITAVTASTLTFSQNATSSGITTVTAEDTAFIRWGDGGTDRISLAGTVSVSTHTDLLDPYGTEYGDASPYVFSWQFSSRLRCGRQGSGAMWVSNPSNYQGTDWGDLNAASGSPTTGGTSALQSVHRARLYWSKFQEPEHTTLLNLQDVGVSSGVGGGAIVGLAGLRDALIILKRDGVFRLTGSKGSFRIDPIATGVHIIGGRSTQVLRDAVYTLSAEGLVRITANGTYEIVSQNIVGDWFREAGPASGGRMAEVRGYMRSNDGYHPPALFAAADPLTGEYVLMCNGDTGVAADGVQDEMLVYNAVTNAFTTWSLDESGTYGVSALGFSDGYLYDTDQIESGIVIGRQTATGRAAVYLLDNSGADTDFATDVGHYTQTYRWRAAHLGSPTIPKQWVDVVWDVDTEEQAATSVVATYGDEDDPAQASQTVGTVSTNEIRLTPSRNFSRHTKPVFGLSGNGVKILGTRFSVREAGKRAPL